VEAIRQDFTMWRGATTIVEFAVVTAAGAPADVTGWTAVLTLRLHSSDADPVALAQAAAIFGTPTNGILRATITKAASLLVAAGRYTFTLERSNTGNEDVLAYGTATVRLDVVNAP
jgi:hypothetical protein